MSDAWHLRQSTLATWGFLIFSIAAATSSDCTTGFERDDATGECALCEPGIGCGFNASVGFPIGIYGPFTSTSQDLFACAVLFDIDIRKHFEPELQTRFGPPVVDIPLVHNSSRIHTQLGTSDSKVATGVRTTLNWFQGIGNAIKVGAIVGGLQSDVAAPVASNAQVFSVPQVAYGATSNSLSDRAIYPWLVRTKPPASLQATAMWSWVTYFGMPGCSCAYTRESYGQGLFQATLAEASADGKVNKLLGVAMPILLNDGDPIDGLLAACDSIVASGKRFILLQAASVNANNMMYALELKEMLYSLYQILGTDGIQLQSERQYSPSSGFPIGWQKLQPVSRGPLYPRFLEMWQKLTENDLYGEEARQRYMLDFMLVKPWEATRPMLTEADFSTRSPFFIGAFLFDAAYTVFVAVNNLLLRGLDGQDIHGRTLLEEMKNTSFEGVTGVVAYDSNSDRYGNFDLMNQQREGDDLVLTVVGTWEASSESFLFPNLSGKVLWATGILSELAPPELIACKPGWQYDFSLDLCTACPTNWYSPGGVGDASFCVPCDAGEVSNSSSAATSCRSCEPGTYRAIADANCIRCPQGTSGPAAGQSACVECPLGTYSDAHGLVDCAHCGVGRSSQTLFTTMSNVTVNGKTEYSYLLGATHASHCGCDRGARNDDNGECIVCTEGMVCSGMNDVRILPGYYSPPDGSWDIFSCHGHTNRCVGGLPGESCAPGRTGTLCSECLHAMRPGSDGVCVDCGGSDNVPLVSGLLLLLAILVVTYHFLDTQNRATQSHAFLLFSIAVAQLVTVAQLLAVVSMLPLELKEPVRSLVDVLSMFTFNIEVLRLSCVGSYTPLQLYAFKVFLIFFTVVVMAVIHCGFVACRHKMAFNSRRHALIGAVGTLFMAFYIAVTAVVLEPLQCLQHPNGRWTMRSEASVLCWEGEEHASMLVLATFAWVSVPMSYLAACAYIVWQFPSRMRDGDARFLQSFTFLFFRYRSSQHTYVLVQMLRSLFIALVLVIPDEVTQAFSLEVVLLLAFSAILYCMPWRVHEANLLDGLLCGGTLIIVCIVSFFLADDQKSLDAIAWVSVTLVIATLSLIPMTMACAVHKRWMRANKPFKFFLCHHKAGAGGFARLLKLTLQEGQRANLGVFLDSDNLDDLDYLFEYVRTATETLVAVCSGAIFTRPWCVGEMCNAHLKRINTLLVALPSCQLPDNGFIAEIEARVENLQVLLENGITLNMLRATLVWIRQQPQIQTAMCANDAVLMAVAEHILHGQSTADPIVNVAASTDVSAQCPTFFDTRNLEAAAAAYVLKKMMIPLLINGHHDFIPWPMDDPEAALAKDAASTIIVICTNGMFESREFLMIAARMNLIMTSQTALLPLIAEQSFRFPASDMSMQLQRTASTAYNETSDPVTAAAVAIASWVSALFKQIGMQFLAQNASEAELRLAAAQITKRLLAKQLSNSKRGSNAGLASPQISPNSSRRPSVASVLSEEEQLAVQQIFFSDCHSDQGQTSTSPNELVNLGSSETVWKNLFV